MNSVETGNEQMNLGGGDDAQEPEGEKSNEESTENSQFAGMNKFGDYGYDTSGYGDYGPPGLYWPNGFYTLKKIEEETEEREEW